MIGELNTTFCLGMNSCTILTTLIQCIGVCLLYSLDLKTTKISKHFTCWPLKYSGVFSISQNEFVMKVQLETTGVEDKQDINNNRQNNTRYQ